MSQTPENFDPFEDIVHAASHELTGNFPGMPELIQELNHQSLGRLIVRMPHTKQQGLLDLMIRGSEQAKPEQEQVGYSLPLNHEETEHLVLFANGRMYVTKAQQETVSRRSYKDYISSATAPLVLYGDSLASAEQFFVKYADLHGVDKDAMISNTNPAQVGQIHTARRGAVVVSREIKQARDRAVEETASALINDFNELLNPKPKPPESEQQ